MHQEADHEMIFGGIAANGNEEWQCSICNRHIQVRFHPIFKQTVIERGDEIALHFGSRSMPGVQFRLSSMQATNDPFPPDATDERLSVWREWLDQSQVDL